jgi:hypothetical protein
MTNPLSKNGKTTIRELTQAYKYETDRKSTKMMRMILSSFPESLIKISKYYNDEINSNSEEMKYTQIAPEVRKDVTVITAKELQVVLKNALGKIESLIVNIKLGIENYDEENISKFRIYCKNPKLRNKYFRQIHNDFYTRVRMKKFGMMNTDKCPRCGEVRPQNICFGNVHTQETFGICLII